MIKEMLGREDGLCGGRAGHMHLSSFEHLAAASGIVGAAGPLADGFALAAKSLRPGCVGVAVFGEGAANEGTMMEAENLAAAWSLPTIFICKDNGWSITTRSASVTGGDLAKRAEAMGLSVQDLDGLDPVRVWQAAGTAFERARGGGGPQFLRLTCSRLDGHFLGDPLLRTARRPITEGGDNLKKIFSSLISAGGAGIPERTAGLVSMMKTLLQARKDDSETPNDPLWRARRALRSRAEEVARIEERTDELIAGAVAAALGGAK
jgi:pyruvate dehydrogenase E1 component alpha subunit